MALNVFGKLREGLRKTREKFADRVRLLLRSDAALTPELLEELEELLIEADIGVATEEELIEEVREAVKRDKIKTADEVYELLKKSLEANLRIGDGKIPGASPHGPLVIMVVGVNGTGKTTSIGKMAHYYRRSGKKVLLAAGDTYRAAANEQLDEWSKRSGVDIIRSVSGADPAAVAFDAAAAALNRQMDILIIDTAGRLHTRVNLMEELKKIERVVKKVIPGAPHEVLLVLDANTGQNGIVQAREFFHAVPVTGLILAKVDGTAKGGIIVSITRQLGIPVKFIGIGEDLEDFQEFDPADFVNALFSE